MPSIIFVHGTGTRKESYDESLNRIKAQLKREIIECRWGEERGVVLHKGGLSIPDFDATRAIDQFSDEDRELAIWAALYEDPLCELRLLGVKPQSSGGFRPNQRNAYQQLELLLPNLRIEGELAAQLRKCRLTDVWEEAARKVTSSAEYARAMVNSAQLTTELRYAVARAFTAQALSLYHEQYDDVADWISGADRDLLVESLVTELGGAERGVVASWALKQLLARPFTRYARRRRGKLSEQNFAAAGDILFYQARGQTIRDFIRQTIEASPPPRVLLAHSLGGIACVDLLVERELAEVELLVTVGSQAPFLYEMDALVSLRINERLPGHFPKRWLNIYDPRDFLSYQARDIFYNPERPEIEIRDERVDNGQPFPQAHVSYWRNQQVWEKINEGLLWANIN
jgi:hypothetical protein